MNSATLPIDPAMFGPLRLDVDDGRIYGAPAAFVATQPFWADLFYVSEHLYGGVITKPGVGSTLGGAFALLKSGSFQPGLPSLHELASAAVCTTPEVRLQTARTLVWLATADRLDPTLFVDVLAERITHSRELDLDAQPLARTVAVIEDALLLGAMPAMWAILEGLADRLSSWDSQPTGTADLMRALVRHVTSVPNPTATPPLRRFAASKGTSKAKQEARAYVAAVDARGLLT